jgi:multiple sugar transport system permease protein
LAAQADASLHKAVGEARNGMHEATLRTSHHARRWSWRTLARALFLLPLALYVAIFYGYPLFYSVQISLEKYDLGAEITGVAPFIGLENYVAVFHDPTFPMALTNTVLFTVLSIVPQFLIGLALAVFFYRRFPLSRPLRSVFLLPWLLPLVVSSTVWKWLFNETNGVIDQSLASIHVLPAHYSWLSTPGWALVALIIANIWLGIPFNMVLLYSGLQNIDHQLYEAAKVDGATARQQFFSITLPLLQPVIGIVLILGFIYTLKVFDLIYVMTQGGPANTTQTFATWAYNLSFVQQDFGQGAAQANLILVISLALALLYFWWSFRTAEGK